MEPMETMVVTTTIIKDAEGGLVEVQTTTEPRPASSVELVTGAKGQIQPKVKIYHEDPDQAARIAIRIYLDLVEQIDGDGK